MRRVHGQLAAGLKRHEIRALAGSSCGLSGPRSDHYSRSAAAGVSPLLGGRVSDSSTSTPSGLCSSKLPILMTGRHAASIACPIRSASGDVDESSDFGDEAMEAMEEPLAFVNRYAEALDVLVSNLANQESLRRGSDVKYKTPLAAQPPGTGKTALGRNLTAILRRPREVDPEVEASIAKRLRVAACWGGEAAKPVDKALLDTRDENLVVRTLLACFPHHHDTVLRLKQSEPIVVKMQELVPPRSGFGADFDAALAYAIFCAVHKRDSCDPAAKSDFLAQDSTLQLSVGAIKEIICKRDNEPLLLVLDDITNLAHTRFADYFKDAAKPTALHRAMTELSAQLQLLHGIPRCFVYCTGRSLWLSSRALRGAESLLTRPVLLQPLTDEDILHAVRTTTEISGQTLLDTLRVDPSVERYFAARAQALTGGVGRVLQFLPPCSAVGNGQLITRATAFSCRGRRRA